MRLLWDTHVFICVLEGNLGQKYPSLFSAVNDQSATGAISVVSLWEIGIKSRLGKLRLRLALEDLADFARENGLSVLPVLETHAVATVSPIPFVRDPFDRLLLATAQCEGLRLVTADRALADHPLAFKP